MEEWGIELNEPEGSRTAQDDPTESTHLGPWGLTETEPPTKVHTGAGHKPPTGS